MLLFRGGQHRCYTLSRDKKVLKAIDSVTKTLVLTKLHLEEKGVSNCFYSKTQMFHGSVDVP